MTAIAIPRTTTSEQIEPQTAVTEILSLLVELPFSMPPLIWDEQARAAGVHGIEQTIRSWADANEHRVYVESFDSVRHGRRIEIVRREDHKTLLVWRGR